jgi:hypothetical protein
MPWAQYRNLCIHSMTISPKSLRCRSSVKGRESRMEISRRVLSHFSSGASPKRPSVTPKSAGAKDCESRPSSSACAKQSIASPALKYSYTPLSFLWSHSITTTRRSSIHFIPSLSYLPKKTRWPAFLPKCMDTSPVPSFPPFIAALLT